MMLPPVCKALGIKGSPTGGWMYSSLYRIQENTPNNQYAVATVWSRKDFKEIDIEGVKYYLLPQKIHLPYKYDNSLEIYWKQIADAFQPDVIHVHGTEFPYGLAYVKANGSHGVLASIQGIISCIARYYTAGIDYGDVKKYLTFRDFIKQDSITQQQIKFKKRGELEKEFIHSIDHFIGRTEWDKAHVKALNPTAEYHYCGETLRTPFYSQKWSYNYCEPHSIFVSQAGYPIKGLHMLLKAMPLILREYPDARIYVAGSDIINVPFYRLSGYAKYLKSLISENSLEGKVFFTGQLDENAMCKRYLKSNVFVCPSSIENSPNSLGEAQLLGMPYVASFVGGVPEIVNWNPDVLYRFEEYEMLAEKICKIFDNKDKFIDTSDLTRYDGERNSNDLLQIYTDINQISH